MDIKEQITNITLHNDYPVLKKLASALWQQDSTFQGAAVMVGAGFSRSAACSGDNSKKLPLWYDLSKTLKKELGQDSNENSDPLRLAEEYYAYFGKQALHDLIKKEINDASWIPGELYTTLLELPWSEVLTTNWDTLLERTASEIHQPVYNVVSKQEDLSSAHSPRIVKLHGTVNISNDLIFTQEDYRKYPQRYAAMVNFARQVFIENELCLIGFSGDDPNFLQWAGWVRDNLSNNARRIYLVGSLNLTAAKRKYLESLNVSPIDLHDLVADYDSHDDKHKRATEIFLNALDELRPPKAWDWSPTNLHQLENHEQKLDDDIYKAKLLKKKIAALEADRKTYPGWLICPEFVHEQLERQIRSAYPSKENLSLLDPENKEKLLYEISWRYGITFQTINPQIIEELISICDPNTPNSLTIKQQLDISILILISSRSLDESISSSIKGKVLNIISSNNKYWHEGEDEVLFHNAMCARDIFNYHELEETAKKIKATTPINKIRKAGLLAEIQSFDESEVLLSEAYNELLKQYRNNKNSIYIKSRLAWAYWILNSINALKNNNDSLISDLRESKCDVWNHVEKMDANIYRAVNAKQRSEKQSYFFEAGHYSSKKPITYSKPTLSVYSRFENIT
ncbi:SIR2 family protein [Klebsiella sp. Ap-873]|nr:SIR2 family protein [Klebsiella sp. Ap-873]